jgi:hypothetical protein
MGNHQPLSDSTSLNGKSSELDNDPATNRCCCLFYNAKKQGSGKCFVKWQNCLLARGCLCGYVSLRTAFIICNCIHLAMGVAAFGMIYMLTLTSHG